MTSWEIPQEVLSAAAITNTATTGSAFDHIRLVDVHALTVTVASFAGGTNVVVFLQGSLDGINWFEMVQVVQNNNGTFQVVNATSAPVRYTRVYAVTEDSGTSGTVTATIVSGSLA